MQWLRRLASPLLALALTVGLGAWLALPGPPPGDSGVAIPQRDAPLRVQVETSKARQVARPIVVSARTEAARLVTLKGEIDSRVVAVAVAEGAVVATGDVIARLDAQDLPARLAEAQALVAQRALELRAAERLMTRDLLSETDLAAARTQREAARAQVATIEEALEKTVLRAPFAGVVDRRHAELGDLLLMGDPVAELLELDPLHVVGDVAQRDVARLRLGQGGEARLATGEVVTGTLQRIARAADAATRTFRVELVVDNPGLAMGAGVSAELLLTTESLQAHYLSPALLTLDGAGQLGVKGVAEDNRVVFYPVTILTGNADGVWVQGLPPQLQVITLGQGFVQMGQQVVPVAPVAAAGGGG
ncbi:MAG: efflux RND transporter periplasmic adaptor subunit [Candidatus Competibacterales bacterium]